VKLNLVTLGIILIFVVSFLFHSRGLSLTPSRIIGVTVAVLLLIVARLQLGGAFSVHPKASTLVTRDFTHAFEIPSMSLARCLSQESSSGLTGPGFCFS